MRFLALLALLVACSTCSPASAAETVLRSSVTLKVGETCQIAVFGGHKNDCVTSLAPNSVQVIQSPRLGTLSQRDGAPYIVRDSISGTCIGSRFVGRAVDYTAHVPGTDTVALDGVFDNGTGHRVITITVVP